MQGKSIGGRLGTRVRGYIVNDMKYSARIKYLFLAFPSSDSLEENGLDPEYVTSSRCMFQRTHSSYAYAAEVQRYHICGEILLITLSYIILQTS